MGLATAEGYRAAGWRGHADVTSDDVMGEHGDTMLTVRRFVIFAIVCLAIALFFVAGRQRAEDVPVSQRDPAVEGVEPADGSPVAVRQARIGIDLAPGHRAALAIQGVEIPEDQLDRSADALNQVFFQPGPGKVIEELEPGPVTATAYIWHEVEGETREDARTFSWSFSVA